MLRAKGNRTQGVHFWVKVQGRKLRKTMYRIVEGLVS
jgi:hypothetical protein